MPTKGSHPSQVQDTKSGTKFSNTFLQPEQAYMGNWRLFLCFNFLSYSLRKTLFLYFPRGIFWSCSCLPTSKYNGFLYCVSINLKTIICNFQGIHTHKNQCILVSFIGNLKGHWSAQLNILNTSSLGLRFIMEFSVELI